MRFVYLLLFFTLSNGFCGLIAQDYPQVSAENQNKKVKFGIDVLIESNFQMLKGKRVALLTNYAGRTSSGLLTADAFIKQSVCQLYAILVPEHGFYTAVPAGVKVENSEYSGVPILSLYKENRQPDPELFSNIDAIVVDIQDIGIRSYTYLSTLYKTMDACAAFRKPIYVLDRPNPLGGISVDGNTVEKGMESFVGIIPVSYIHGCTLGELANMINEEGWLPRSVDGLQKKCDLTVVEMQNWNRWMLWEDVGANWFPTSPHIPTVNAVRGMAVIGVFGELGFISVGIGTTLPFQYVGSPGFLTKEVMDKLGTEEFDGINLAPCVYNPFYGMYANKFCNGIQLIFPLSNDFRPYTSGIKIMLAIRQVHPDLFADINIKENSQLMFEKVTGTKKIYSKMFTENTSDGEILQHVTDGLLQYLIIRGKYLIY